MRKLGIADLHFIVHVDLSEEQFPAKPNASVYERVERFLYPEGSSPSTIYFADDRLNNIETAAGRGSQSVLVDESLANVPDIDSLPSISVTYELSKVFSHFFLQQMLKSIVIMIKINDIFTALPVRMLVQASPYPSSPLFRPTKKEFLVICNARDYRQGCKTYNKGLSRFKCGGMKMMEIKISLRYLEQLQLNFTQQQ
jgi:hypothetical protein